MITFKKWLEKKVNEDMNPILQNQDVTATLGMLGKVFNTNPNVNSISNAVSRFPTLAKALATNPNIQRYIAPTAPNQKPQVPNPINPAQPTTAPAKA